MTHNTEPPGENRYELALTLLEHKYVVTKIVSNQSNSVVYKVVLAEDISPNSTSLPKEAAMKVIPASEDGSFHKYYGALREARALRMIQHKNVVKFYDLIVEPNLLCYLALEFIDGKNLATMIKSLKEPLPVFDAINYTIQLLEGVERIHSAGILHRDIKPENILLSNTGLIKIIDFSTARCPGDMQPIEHNLAALGTVEYISPECLQGRVQSILSDIYAVGVTFYQMLTNQLPFEGKTVKEQLASKIKCNIPPLSSYLPEPYGHHLIEVIHQALAVETQRRFQSARDFKEALLSAKKTIEIKIAEEANPKPPKKESKMFGLLKGVSFFLA